MNGEGIMAETPDAESPKPFLVAIDDPATLAFDADAAFDVYVKPLLNLANFYSKGTGPNGPVGSVNQTIRNLRPESYDEWVECYQKAKPEAVLAAAKLVRAKLDQLRAVAGAITDDHIQAWVEDLVLPKTYRGFVIQQLVLDALGARYDLPTTPGTAKDEPKGIDGFLGNQPVSIKPESYKNDPKKLERIKAPIVFYKVTKGNKGLVLDASALEKALGI